jgi:hypothetical protein
VVSVIWHFKKRHVVPFEEIAAAQPPAPCGEQTIHYHWELLEEMPCPRCAARRAAARRDADEERLATLIAAKVAALIK